MFSRNSLIYTSVVTSQFGRMLTYLSLAISLLEVSGSSSIAYGLIFQSLPAFVLTKYLVKKIPVEYSQNVFVLFSFLSAINVLSLAAHFSVEHVYIYYLISGVLSAYMSPMLQSFISEWVEGDDSEIVRTRINALKAIAAAIAPILGGIVGQIANLKILFIADAIIFAMSAICVQYLNKRVHRERDPQLSKAHSLREDTHSSMPKELLRVLGLWYVFLIAGACINGFEFAIFDHRNLNRLQIGIALSSWGFGGALAYFAATKAVAKKSSIFSTALFFIFGLIGIAFAENFLIICISMAIAGSFDSLFAGKVQARIQNQIPHNMDQRTVWASVYQTLCVINTACFLLAGWLLSKEQFKVSSLLLVPLSACMLLLYVAYNRKHYSHVPQVFT